jgi:hypothetical protein
MNNGIPSKSSMKLTSFPDIVNGTDLHNKSTSGWQWKKKTKIRVKSLSQTTRGTAMNKNDKWY